MFSSTKLVAPNSRAAVTRSRTIPDDHEVRVREVNLCRAQGFGEIIILANTDEDQHLLASAGDGAGHVRSAWGSARRLEGAPRQYACETFTYDPARMYDNADNGGHLFYLQALG